MHSVETILYILNFDLSLAGDIWYNPLSLCWAAGSEHSSPSASNHEGKQPIHLQPFCTQTTILFFTFSIVFNK